MESDDDYQSFSPLEDPSPPTQTRKLKRLKKTIRISENPIVNSSEEESFSVPLVDSSNSDNALDSSEPQGLEDSNEPLRFGSESEGLDEEKESGDGFESSQFRPESGGFDEEGELNFGSESSHLKVSGLGVKRALEFDDVDGEVEGEDGGGGGGEEIRGEDGGGGGGEEIMGEDADSDDKKRRISEELGEKKEKKKNKRVKSDGDEEKRKVAVSDKRRAEKERRDYLKHLHAETQRLLRETRDAAFKPVPVIQKPISSILEKIRQRKLEVSKLIVSRKISTCESDDSSRDILMDLDSENPSIDDREDDEIGKVVIEETSMHPTDVGSSLDASDINGSTEFAEGSNHEHIPSQVVLDEAKHAFRAPIDDTQDILCDSQSSDSIDEQPSEQDDSPVEEAFAPSLLAMNLKFDSAPPDEMSSDEEDNDKENMYPSEPGLKLCSTSKGDPVKAFLDEEAEEEDDSDNDLSRFKDNEEEDDMEDAEELKDMIATAYEEKPIDDEKRHQLHMKWLEQQDAFGTDKLLQKFRCGSNYEETTLLEEEDDRVEDEEEFSDEATEDLLPMNVARMNAKKVKQMIPQMFTDKDDAYLSSDDEETEKLIVKQRLLRKAEDQATFLSPVEDESSREVFGLIKKLNIVPDTKRKAKTSSSFDMMSTRRSNSSSKSSFLGKVSNNSMSSSHKRVSSTVRSYIFGRDDSNSRSAITESEESSDTIQKEARSTKTFTAKFSNSQSKSSSQNTETTTETVSGTSLFEILRRSSLQTNHSNRGEVVAQTQSVFAAFKLSKHSMKIERQS